MPRLLTRIALAACLALPLASHALAQEEAPPQPGHPQGRHCPDNPAGTFKFFEKGANTEADKARLATLAGIARQQSGVCLLALTDPANRQSRSLAIRRLKWVLDGLTANGVPRDKIAYELRPQPSDPDSMRLVQVILGR